MVLGEQKEDKIMVEVIYCMFFVVSGASHGLYNAIKRKRILEEIFRVFVFFLIALALIAFFQRNNLPMEKYFLAVIGYIIYFFSAIITCPLTGWILRIRESKSENPGTAEG